MVTFVPAVRRAGTQEVPDAINNCPLAVGVGRLPPPVAEMVIVPGEPGVLTMLIPVPATRVAVL
jgi:hypothetical protein